MGKPNETDVKVNFCFDRSGINRMQVVSFWDDKPINNVKALLVELTPQGMTRSGEWKGVLYLENEEEYEVHVCELEEDETISPDYYEGFGFR